ncbi:MAG: hypothetical protein V7607_111 [Solirubrobacteraceae bacterium]
MSLESRGGQPERRDVDDRDLELAVESSRMSDGMPADVALSRRRLLATMGAGAVAGAGAFALARPESAFAGTTGIYWDQGGAVFNVMAYGADNTGATNTRTAIASAITAAQSAGGGVVYFPAGTYRIDSGLSITANGITLMGAGIGATTIKAGSSFTTGDMLYFNQVRYGRVVDLTIDSTNTRTSGAGINLYGINQGGTSFAISADHIVHNVCLNNQFTGIYINDKAFLAYVDRVYITNLAAGGVGIDINTIASGAMGESQFISNVFIQGHGSTQATMPAAGIQIRASGDFTLRSVSLTLCWIGLLINPVSGARVEAGFIDDCLWDSCGNRCISITPDGTSRVRWMTFVGNWVTGAGTLDGLYLDGNTTQVTVTSCRFLFSQSYGFIANGGSEIFVDNCEASGNSANTAYIAAGIAFAQNASYFAARNCFTNGAWISGGPNTQAYGIRVFSGCDHYILTNNLAVNNTTSQIVEPAATNRVVANNLTT